MIRCYPKYCFFEKNFHIFHDLARFWLIFNRLVLSRFWTDFDNFLFFEELWTYIFKFYTQIGGSMTMTMPVRADPAVTRTKIHVLSIEWFSTVFLSILVSFCFFLGYWTKLSCLAFRLTAQWLWLTPPVPVITNITHHQLLPVVSHDESFVSKNIIFFVSWRFSAWERAAAAVTLFLPAQRATAIRSNWLATIECKISLVELNYHTN